MIIPSPLKLMFTNLYTNPSIFNTLLTPENCQAIHFHALQMAVSGKINLDDVPESLRLIQLRQEFVYTGYESCFRHPSYINDIFHGVSTDILSTIEELYCDPIQRSFVLVHRILEKMADEANVPPVSYEAVWAICTYIDRLHKKRAVVKHQSTEDSWYIHVIPSNLKTCDVYGEIYTPQFVVVMSEQKSQTLGFALSNHRNKQSRSMMALYEALSNGRQPAPLETAGIIWHKPTNIKTPASLLPMLREPCKLAGIYLQETLSYIPNNLQTLIDRIHKDRVDTLSQDIVEESKLALLFDTYLFKAHGYSPGRTKKNKTYTWRNLVGYNRDPASLLPQLRNFLPTYKTKIEKDIVTENGFHYEHPLLAYWNGSPATLRISYEDDSRCWVYVEDEVLCEARARELRRLDGSYKDNRKR